jgi:hypothetical protein
MFNRIPALLIEKKRQKIAVPLPFSASQCLRVFTVCESCFKLYHYFCPQLSSPHRTPQRVYAMMRGLRDIRSAVPSGGRKPFFDLIIYPGLFASPFMHCVQVLCPPLAALCE